MSEPLAGQLQRMQLFDKCAKKNIKIVEGCILFIFSPVFINTKLQ